METTTTPITVETTVNAPVEKVWQYWSLPEHITQWNAASEDWHTPRAQNDLREGGQFTARMESRDGSMGFDFSGTYDQVKNHERIVYHMEDGRKVDVHFQPQGNQTRIVETFDAENQNSLEMQKFGWQSILDNFKKYVENN